MEANLLEQNLFNFEMSKSSDSFIFLNFQNNINNYNLKVNMNMLSGIPLKFKEIGINEDLYPLIINTYEHSKNHNDNGISTHGFKKGNVYFFDGYGKLIQHLQSLEDDICESYQNRPILGYSDLLKHNHIFKDSLNIFESIINKEAEIQFIKNDPREKFVKRIKSIDGLIID